MDFDKLRARRSVLKRTNSNRKELPKLVLYLEWLGGTSQRKVMDSEQNEHVLDDKIVQSYYKLVSGSEAKDLLAQHWPAAATAASVS